jgi:hypothetical protein
MNVPTYMCTLQIFHPSQGGYLTPEMFQLVLQTKIDSQKAKFLPAAQTRTTPGSPGQTITKTQIGHVYEAPQNSRRLT